MHKYFTLYKLEFVGLTLIEHDIDLILAYVVRIFCFCSSLCYTALTFKYLIMLLCSFIRFSSADVVLFVNAYIIDNWQ